MFRAVFQAVLLLGLMLAAGSFSPQAFAGGQAAPALAEAKLKAARVAYEANLKALPTGQSDAEKVYVWSRRLLEAQRDLSTKKADRVAAVEEHLARMKVLREMVKQRYATGRTPFA